MARISHLWPVLFLVAVLVAAAGCTAPPAGEGRSTATVPTTGAPRVDADPATVLAAFTADMNESFEALDGHLSSAAASLGRNGLTGEEANVSLGLLATTSPQVADAVAVDTRGRIVAAMPAEYAGVIGTDISNQSHIQQALRERRPMMSGVFTTVEGFDAVVLVRPVTSLDGTFTGLVVVVFDPSMMMADRADRAIAGTTLSAWGMEPGGRILYDNTDFDEIGKNILTDPAYGAYPELVALAKRMAVEPSGNGTYTYPRSGGGPVVKKDAVWSTAGIHGGAWRLVVLREG
jgi:hypothetical protein